MGVYKPTDRNKLVEHHYSKLGFSSIGPGDDGSMLWDLDADNAVIEDAAMTVHSFGFG